MGFYQDKVMAQRKIIAMLNADIDDEIIIDRIQDEFGFGEKFVRAYIKRKLTASARAIAAEAGGDSAKPSE